MSSEELSGAYEKILETGLFKNIEFIRNGSELLISVEEYPTINQISFEGNKKFTDERLASFLTLRPRFALSPKTLNEDLNIIISAYQNIGRIQRAYNQKL